MVVVRVKRGKVDSNARAPETTNVYARKIPENISSNRGYRVNAQGEAVIADMPRVTRAETFYTARTCAG